MMQRGGRPELEAKHGVLLLEGGAADIWGWGTPAGQERVRRRTQWLSEVCNMGPESRVLECGCGIGIFTRRLAETRAQITAIDISSDLLTRARQECLAPNVTFIEGNLEDPHVLPEGAFDVLCGVSVLHHLVVSKALTALRTKLRPGAYFAFSEPNLLNPLNKYYYFVDDVEKRRQRGISPAEMAFKPDELFRLFTESGFVVEELKHRDFLHPATPKSLIPLMKNIEAVAEAFPLIHLWSGSLWIRGRVA